MYSHYSAQILLLVFAGILLSPCLSAPTKTTYWWNLPCGTNEEHGWRHIRSVHNDLIPIRDALTIFIKGFKSHTRKIHKLYDTQPSNKYNAPIGKVKWLKLKKIVKTIGTATNNKNYLPELYKAFQQFGASAEIISNIPFNTDSVSPSFNEQERKNIYFNVTGQMKSIMCEVYEVLIEKYKTQPPILTLEQTKAPLRKLKSIDLTSAHILDINYFKKLGSFIKQVRPTFKSKQNNVKNNKKSEVKSSKIRTKNSGSKKNKNHSKKNLY